MLSRDPLPKIVTFDCYGTLVQWQRAMRDAAGAVLSAHGGDGVSDHLKKTVADDIRAAATTFQQQSPYRRYQAVLRSSLEKVLADLNLVATEADHRTLWSTLARIAPHPDTPAALASLRSRFRLGIISNTDDDLIAGTIEDIGAPIDFVVTAQQAEAYKPDHRLFEYAHAKMKVAKNETIHVAMGQFADLKVCHELGIRSVWIDREGEPPNPDWPPDATLSDLSGLPDLLLQL